MRTTAAVTALAATFGIIGIAPPGQAVAESPGPAALGLTRPATQVTTRTSPGEPHVVTLITGEQLSVRKSATGEYVARGVKGSGAFLSRQIGGRSYVIPAKVAGLVSSGVVDKRLFDLGELASLPAGRPHLLVEHGPAFEAANFAGGVAVPVVDATALSRPPEWETLLGSIRRREISRIWLDGGIHPQLEDSVPQVGAPKAWKTCPTPGNCLTGKGTRVAVLDTGIDVKHPDLAGRVVESKNFTSDPDIVDREGHGTHVASIVGGSGAASHGRRKGVAPGADLVVGKVCGEEGCEVSDLIAGMEWASRRAKVVNLSLGGTITDGKDPISLALNRLTAKTGTLFVVSAGNAGPGSATITSPGTADAALTVGSVTKGDNPSPYSSKGPRWGDSAVKPDITAPGYRIAAAMASTADLSGVAIGKYYAELSGTSMAAPHVAGAAAILAQQHPSWKADRLKAALMGAALPRKAVTVYEQGAGRLDVARAVGQSLTATPGSLSFGIARFPHHDDQLIHRVVTYHNDGARPVTLTLALQTSAPAGFFSLSTSSLVVPAGGKAKVTVTANPALRGRTGLFGGRVIARGNDGSLVRTAFGIEKEVSSHRQKFVLLGKDGKPAGTDEAGLVLVDTSTGDWFEVPLNKGSGSVWLPDGRYLIDAAVMQTDHTVRWMLDPERAFSSARTTVLDARKAKLVTVHDPRPDAFNGWLAIGGLRVLRSGPAAGTRYITGAGAMNFSGDPEHSKIYAAPTRQVARNEFSGWMNAMWAKPSATGGSLYENTPFVYNQVKSWPGVIPSALDIPFRPGEFARLDTRYATSLTKPAWVASDALPSLKMNGRRYSLSIPFGGLFIGMSLPAGRTDYISAAERIDWSRGTDVYRDAKYTWVDSEQLSEGRSYRSGRFSERWNAGVYGPAFPDVPEEGMGVVYAPWWAGRDGDTITTTIPLFSASGRSQSGLSVVKTQETRLYRNGTLVRRSTVPYGQLFRVRPGAADYRLVSKASRPTSRTSSSVEAEWTFRSARTPFGKKAPLPLLAVRFAPLLDSYNRAPGGREYVIPVLVQRQASKAQVSELDIEVSYDDGKTWRAAKTKQTGSDTFAVRVVHPAKGFVTLRAKASDARGETVTQTITRAYQLR